MYPNPKLLQVNLRGKPVVGVRNPPGKTDTPRGWENPSTQPEGKIPITRLHVIPGSDPKSDPRIHRHLSNLRTSGNIRDSLPFFGKPSVFPSSSRIPGFLPVPLKFIQSTGFCGDNRYRNFFPCKFRVQLKFPCREEFPL